MTLPNFLCIGAQKGGTTTLFNILKEHPDIYISEFKEPHYFDLDDNYSRGLQWYKDEYFNKYNNEKMIGAFTPTYMASSEAPKRILQDLGENVKLIFLLRNPIDRAYSQYLHRVRNGHETEGFIDALALEKSRLKQYLSENNQVSFIYHSYTHQGLYFKHINNYLNVFDQTKMMISIFDEDFLLNKQKMISELLTFLNVKYFPLDLSVHSNPAAVSRFTFVSKMLNKDFFLKKLANRLIKSKITKQRINNKLYSIIIKPKQPPKLSIQERTFIYQTYFKKDIERLENLLKRNLNVWVEN